MKRPVLMLLLLLLTGLASAQNVTFTFNVYSSTGGLVGNITIEDFTTGLSYTNTTFILEYDTNPHTFKISAPGYYSARVVAVPDSNKQFTIYLSPIPAPTDPEPVGKRVGELFVGNETDKGIIGDRVLTGFVALIIIFAFLVMAKVDASVGLVIGLVLIIALAAGGYLPQAMLFVALFIAGGLAYYVVINAIGVGRR